MWRWKDGRVHAYEVKLDALIMLRKNRGNINTCVVFVCNLCEPSEHPPQYRNEVALLKGLLVRSLDDTE